MTFGRQALTAIVVAVLAPAAAGAQWLNYPTPGLPRLPDGKPNLAAAPLRTADGRVDLSGIWIKDTPGTLDYFYDLAKGLPPGDVVMKPWADAIARQRESRNHIDDPWGYCLAPPGVPRINVRPGHEPHLPADPHRWPPAADESGADMARLLDRTLGRRRPGGDDGRLS
jgi:hypothetical protein